MNVIEYTSLINNSNAINDIQSITLEKIAQEFPYFQSARALYLKGLYNQNSFKYNYALKITAAHTTDRTVLFDFISSDSFVTIHKGLYDKKVAELLGIPANEIEIINDDSPKLEQRINTVEESILISIKNATPAVEQETVVVENKPVEKPEFRIPSEKDYVAIETIVAEKTEESIAENLEIGKPLVFSKSEKHSFQEWLQLSKLKPIIRNEEIVINNENTSELNFEKQKKNELIDKFIETSPKIPPIKHDSQVNTIVFEPSISNNSYLMTETLARVYLEQKKYQKAIQAYQILILKYPEKSSFFADRILDIKNLQQNNK